MKVLLTSILSAFLFGATDAPAELLDRKWFFGYLRANGQVQELPLKVPDAKRPWFYFRKDGHYQQSMDGRTEEGKWIYTAGKRTLRTVVQYNTASDTTVFILERVTSDSLELKDPDGTILGMVGK